MLVFHNGSNVSYANNAGNLSSMSSATAAITLRFASTVGTTAANDIVVLTVTAGKEEAAMEQLAGLFGKGTRRGMSVVADDQNSKYLIDAITAVNSISVDNGSGTFKSLIPATFTTADTGGTDNAIVVTNADSGSEFVVTALILLYFKFERFFRKVGEGIAHVLPEWLRIGGSIGELYATELTE